MPNARRKHGSPRRTRLETKCYPSSPEDFCSLNPVFLEQAKVTRRELDAAFPNAGPDEQLLHQLVSEEIAIASALLEAEVQLSERLLLLIDNPKLLVHITKSLKDVVHLRNSVTRRIEGALGVASNLRAQRRFIARTKKSSKMKGRADEI